MNAIKQELKVNGKDLFIMLLIQLCFFLFGMILVSVILFFDKNEATYFSMGLLFSLITVLFSSMIYDGLVYQTRYQLAISMGRSRRGLLLSYFATVPLRSLILIGSAWVLGKVELLLYRILYPTLTNEVDFYVIFDWRIILPAVIVVTVLGLFIAAIYGRFGQKGWMVFYFGMLACCFLFARVSKLVGSLEHTGFGRFLDGAKRILGSIGISGWIVLGVIALLMLLGIALKQMLRQPVQF